MGEKSEFEMSCMYCRCLWTPSTEGGNVQQALGYMTDLSEIYPRGVYVHLDLIQDQRYPVLGMGSYVSYGISLLLNFRYIKECLNMREWASLVDQQ